MTLDEAADELYGLPLTEFTARRDALAAETARAGDRELAAAVKRLRKPTTGAWVANLLARQRPTDVEKLTALGASLRSAQGRLAGDDLRRLSQQRQELLGALSAEAVRLARHAGQAVGEAVAAEVAETLEAALADEDAALALRAGRLTTRLRRNDLGLGDADAGGPGAGAGKGKGKAAAIPSTTPPRAASASADGRRSGGSEGGLRQAKAAAVEARRRVALGRAARERADREVDRLTARVGELEESLRTARAAAGRARKAQRSAQAEERRALEAEARAEARLRGGG